MSDEGSITRWIDLLKKGDHEAAQPLWDAYFRRLVMLARAKLRSTSRRVSDEEDVAISAFDSFCRGAERGRFPKLLDRDDLWQLLVVITVRKAYDLVRHEGRKTRGAGRVLSFADLVDSPAAQALGSEPTPELAAQVAESCQLLLDRLGDDTLRLIALRKMEGDTNEEIATKLGCVRYTVDRKIQRIRNLWSAE